MRLRYSKARNYFVTCIHVTCCVLHSHKQSSSYIRCVFHAKRNEFQIPARTSISAAYETQCLFPENKKIVQADFYLIFLLYSAATVFSFLQKLHKYVYQICNLSTSHTHTRR